MSSTKSVDSSTRDRADWSEAWGVVARLAAARGMTLQETTGSPQDAAGPTAPGSASAGAPVAAIAPEQFAPVVPDQLARDIAEIEKAAEALRRHEPALEQHHPAADPQRDLGVESVVESRQARSVWPLITTIWIFAVLVVAGAIGALELLLG